MVIFLEVLYAWTAEGSFRSQSILWAETILFRIFYTVLLALSVNPLAIGWYGVVFQCLIIYWVVMLINTSLRKCFPRSLTNSSGCPNRIMISSNRNDTAVKASFFTVAQASTHLVA